MADGAAAGGRVRGEHRRHVHGAVERAVQELPAPRGGEPRGGAQVAGLLPVPEDGPGGAAAAGPGRRPQPAGLPGLHLGSPA